MTYTDEEIIKALECCQMAIHNGDFCTLCPYYKIENCAFDSANDILDLIERQQAELEKRQWISVDDRLPSEQDADDIGMVLAVHKTSKKRCYHWRIVVDNPFDFTYWMPLPEPPKGV